MTPVEPEKSEIVRGLALLAWIAWELLALTGAGIALGWLLNRWIGAPMVLSGLFGALGLVLAFVRIYRASQIREKS